MIDFKINPDTGTVNELTFCYPKWNICIPHIQFSTISTYRRSKPNPNGAADIIENFRKNTNTELTEEQKQVVVRAINSVQGKFSPEYIFCFSTSENEINDFITELRTHRVANSPIDISHVFRKKPNAGSVTNKEMSDELDNDYEYNGDVIQTPIKDLLIIDDALNNGRTVNQLLLQLVLDGKINNDSKITISTIYGFLKSVRPKKCGC